MAQTLFGQAPLRGAVVQSSGGGAKRLPQSNVAQTVLGQGAATIAEGLSGLMASNSANKINKHITSMKKKMEVWEVSELRPTELKNKRRMALNDIEKDVNPTEFRKISDASIYTPGRKVESIDGRMIVTDKAGNILNQDPKNPINAIDKQLEALEEVRKIAPAAFEAGNGFIEDIKDPILKSRASNQMLEVVTPRIRNLINTLGQVGGPAGYSLEGVVNVSDIKARSVEANGDIQNKYNLIVSAMLDPSITNAFQNPDGRVAFDRLPTMIRAVNDAVRSAFMADPDIFKYGGMNSATLDKMLSDGVAVARTMSEEIKKTGSYGTKLSAMTQVKEHFTLKTDLQYAEYLQTLPPDIRIIMQSDKAMAAVSSAIAIYKLSGGSGQILAGRLVEHTLLNGHSASLTEMENNKFNSNSLGNMLRMANDINIMTTTNLNRLKAQAERAKKETTKSGIKSELNGIINNVEKRLKDATTIDDVNLIINPPKS
tara:strand:- start:4843 stop:6297 length:1455 start_codon:yes stop_codon:yes gene_type:complete